MSDDPISDVITGIIPSAPRRMFGTVLIGFGAASLYGGYRMWDVTGRRIELTEEELRLSDGTVICHVKDIHKIDRSFFAFKPSNGFLVSTKVSYPFHWAPGLWWRFGKRIGIGGVTPGSQSKIMADTIAALVAQRDGLFKELDL